MENYFTNSLISLLMSKLILFGGKGGVGKTTTSAATAAWAAEHGYRTLIVSSDPAHSTSDSFEQEIGKVPTPIEKVEGLWAMEINPEEEIELFLPDLQESLSRINVMGMDELEFTQDELLIPGLDEALAFDKLLSYVESPFFDLIIFDTAPTGHTLRFLSLPELLNSWIAKILKFRIQISRLKNIITGKKDNTLIDIQNLKKRVEHVRRVLRNDDITSFNIVTIPEQMGIMESRRALQQIQEYQIPVHAIIVNHIFPKDSNCDFCRARRKVQDKYIGQARDLCNEMNMELALITIFKEEVKGINMLRKVGEHLYDKKQINLKLTKTMTIERKEHAIVVSIQFPSAVSREMDLRSDGNDLIIDLNGIINRVPLNEFIENRPISAKFEDDILTITVDMSE